MKNVTNLSLKQIKSIIKQSRTLYLSYLVCDQFIDLTDKKAVNLLKEFYATQNRFWVQNSDDFKQHFFIEYYQDRKMCRVYTEIKEKTSITIHHGNLDLSEVDEHTRMYFISNLYVY